MSTRALTIAGVILLGWAVVHGGHRHAWHHPHIAISSDFQNVDWNDEQLDAALDRLDDLNIDVNDGTVHVGWDGDYGMSREAREQVRAEVREHVARARDEARRARGEFRDERHRMRDEIRNSIRCTRDEFRNDWRANRDEIRRQSRELRDQIRESVRATVRAHRDNDIY